MSSLPITQKALIFNTVSDTLNLNPSAPLPHTTDEHIIKVHSTAITNGELTWMPFTNWSSEQIPCYDVSGTIVTPVLGSPFQVGQRVYGRVNANREGAARQYATILPRETALVPRGLGMLEAASVPMSALTAWQALFEKGLLTGEYNSTTVPYVNDSGEVVGKQAAGKRVLVLGAAGGVGLFAVQFAKLADAWVAGTGSAKNEDFIKNLGADEVIDYTKLSMKEWVGGEASKKFDLVFDCVGGKTMLDGWNAVKDHGVYVSIVQGFEELEGKPDGVRTAWFIMDSRGSELAAIGEFIEKGLVKTWVDSVWKLEEFEVAFAKTSTGHARGKVIIKIDEGEE